jgi:hypothetical protein
MSAALSLSPAANVFASIAATDINAAQVLAHAFRQSATMGELCACLRMARAMSGYAAEFYGWLQGSHFMAAIPGLRFFESPVERLERSSELFAEMREQAWDFTLPTDAAL